MKIPNLHRSIFAILTLGFTAPSYAEVLYRDDFETNTSAQYQLQVGYYKNTATNNFRIDWSFDYLDQIYHLFRNATDFDTLTVPVAPSGSGTKGLKLTVNENVLFK